MIFLSTPMSPINFAFFLFHSLILSLLSDLWAWAFTLLLKQWNSPLPNLLFRSCDHTEFYIFNSRDVRGRVARRHAWNFLLATKGTKCLLFLNSPFKSRPHCKIVSMEITFFKVCQPMAEFGIRSSSLIVDGTHYSKSISIVMRKSER